MQKVENGLFVSVDYTGTLESGEVFDSSKDREPLEVHMGAGNMIPGFESVLMGMSLKESKTFTVEVLGINKTRTAVAVPHPVVVVIPAAADGERV